MAERTKPLRPQPSATSDRLVSWLASKGSLWYAAFAVAGAGVGLASALPLHASWHEVAAWTLLGLAGPTVVLLAAVASATRGRSLVAEAHSLEDLRAIAWAEFEEFVAGLFRARRWEVLFTRREGDGGVDLIVKKKRDIGYIQCKQWRGQVGVEIVRSLYGVMAANCVRRGYVVTTGEFTPEAERFARSVGVHLIGGAALVRHLRTVQRQAAQSA